MLKCADCGIDTERRSNRQIRCSDCTRERNNAVRRTGRRPGMPARLDKGYDLKPNLGDGPIIPVSRKQVLYARKQGYEVPMRGGRTRSG